MSHSKRRLNRDVEMVCLTCKQTLWEQDLYLTTKLLELLDRTADPVTSSSTKTFFLQNIFDSLKLQLFHFLSSWSFVESPEFISLGFQLLYLRSTWSLGFWKGLVTCHGWRSIGGGWNLSSETRRIRKSLRIEQTRSASVTDCTWRKAIVFSETYRFPGYSIPPFF